MSNRYEDLLRKLTEDINSMDSKEIRCGRSLPYPFRSRRLTH